MKKNIITYLGTGLVLIFTRILIYSIVGNINLVAFVIINLVLPSLIIIIANAIINYDIRSTIKKCFLHAVILAMLSLVVSLGVSQIMGDKVMDNLVESDKNENNEGIDKDLWDELDRQARQKMIDEGLISEDEEIYSEPYINNGNSDESQTSDGKLTGVWDVQMEKENMMSTVTGMLFDILLAFVSGVISIKMRKKKEEKV